MAEVKPRPRRSPPAGNHGGIALDTSLLKPLAILSGLTIAFYLCYRLALPFLPALTWAMVLAIVLAPAHRRVERWIRPPGLSASVSVAATVVAAGIPLFFVGQQLAREVAEGAVYLDSTIKAFNWSELAGRHAWLAQATAWLEGRFDVANLLAGLTQWLAQYSTSFFRGSLNQAIGIALTFYMLFYFLRDRGDILTAVAAFSPLTTTETTRITHRLAEAVHASVFGTIVIGLVQGTLGGLMFWWLGLPTPAFWGLLMGLLAIVPLLGAFIIWIPAAVFLVLVDRWGEAAVLVVWGAGVIATIDNLLYPILVGNRLRVHSLAAFIGMVGGIILFGASGLVLGPAVIAITLELIDILKQRSKGPDLI